ncbi:hypothetical protein LCGC14_1950190 [marine sediment metagenome]|uniref:Uncharacterized protein n=1 Tax=marine sediment metagenome TaxID=412755 RepID=A0A0F9HW48_9ZZZZ
MEKQDLTKFVSKKQMIVIATGWAILQTEQFRTQIVLASVAVIYMIIDAIKQIIEIVRNK